MLGPRTWSRLGTGQRRVLSLWAFAFLVGEGRQAENKVIADGENEAQKEGRGWEPAGGQGRLLGGRDISKLRGWTGTSLERWRTGDR